MKKYYKWTLNNDFHFCAPELYHNSRISLTVDGKEWGVLDRGNLSVAKNYSWDGCSPKTKILGIVVGTWDGINIWHKFKDRADYDQQLKYASLGHDILCQFEDQVPISREEIDLFFYRLCKEVKFPMATLYYQAVKRLGGIYAMRDKD